MIGLRYQDPRNSASENNVIIDTSTLTWNINYYISLYIIGYMWRITYLRNKKEDPWSLLTDLASVRRQICLASKLDFGVKTPTGNIQRLRWGGLHLTYGSTIIVVRRHSLIDIWWPLCHVVSVRTHPVWRRTWCEQHLLDPAKTSLLLPASQHKVPYFLPNLDVASEYFRRPPLTWCLNRSRWAIVSDISWLGAWCLERMLHRLKIAFQHSTILVENPGMGPLFRTSWGKCSSIWSFALSSMRWGSIRAHASRTLSISIDKSLYSQTKCNEARVWSAEMDLQDTRWHSQYNHNTCGLQALLLFAIDWGECWTQARHKDGRSQLAVGLENASQ